MTTLEITPINLDRKEYLRRSALESDCKHLIDYDCLITSKGEPKILYIDLTNKIDTSALRWACLTSKYEKSELTAGLKTNSTIFGFMPRRTLLQDFCHVTAMAEKSPKQHYIFTSFAKQLESYYKQYFPSILEKHYDLVNTKLKKDYMLEGTPFTSGIVNKNNVLKYHQDAGNFKGVLSNMVAFKKGVEGGRLCCPEYDVKFEISDNSLLIFDGQVIIHGVTPINHINPKGYRYTVVWYSLEQMWKCEPLKDEVQRIRTVKKSRELKRLSL